MRYKREFIGELTGTFILVLFGCGAVSVLSDRTLDSGETKPSARSIAPTVRMAGWKSTAFSDENWGFLTIYVASGWRERGRSFVYAIF